MAAGVSLPSVNLDEYVTSKAIKALFIEIATQEKMIRIIRLNKTRNCSKRYLIADHLRGFSLPG